MDQWRETTARPGAAGADEDRAFAVPNLLTYARIAAVPLTLVMAIFAMLATLFLRTIEWRGITYATVGSGNSDPECDESSDVERLQREKGLEDAAARRSRRWRRAW